MITPRHLQNAVLDAQGWGIYGLAAERSNNDYLAGWPSAPRSTSSSGKESTGLPVDKHRLKLEEYHERAKRAADDLRWLSLYSLAYGAPASPSIAERIADVETDLWCPHCLKHGHRAVKEQGRTQCRWHRDWSEKHPGIDAPPSLVDAHASGESRAKMGQLYTAWLKANPQVQPKPKGRTKANKAAERGTDVETAEAMVQRFGGAA